MPFLTDQDSRAAIKGSRDPLGLVPVWSRFGRFVVGNLTTVSNSVRGFTTLLLGYHFAEAVRERQGDTDAVLLPHFLKFEQLAGYVRWHVKKDDDFRGRDRVVARLEKSAKVAIGSDSDQQILSNQKIYGLWGLFSVAARASGLLATHVDPVLTPIAREFVEKHYLGPLTRDGFPGGRRIVDLLSSDRGEVNLDGKDSSLAQSLARILSGRITPAERAFYQHHLVAGGNDDSTGGRQPLLAQLLAELPEGNEFGMHELRAVLKHASKQREDFGLCHRLENIATLESLLVPMDNAFLFLLSRDRQPLATVAGDLKRTWGRALKHIDPEAIALLAPTVSEAFGGDSASVSRFVTIATALRGGDYDQALIQLLEHNAFVMQSRNGSDPWVRIVKGKLDVRYRDESATLISRADLPAWWRNTYFINSLQNVATTLRAA